MKFTHKNHEKKNRIHKRKNLNSKNVVCEDISLHLTTDAFSLHVKFCDLLNHILRVCPRCVGKRQPIILALPQQISFSCLNMYLFQSNSIHLQIIIIDHSLWKVQQHYTELQKTSPFGQRCVWVGHFWTFWDIFGHLGTIRKTFWRIWNIKTVFQSFTTIFL